MIELTAIVEHTRRLAESALAAGPGAKVAGAVGAAGRRRVLR